MKRSFILALLLLAAFAPLASAAGSAKIAGTVEPVEFASEVEVCVVEATPSETCTVPAANGSYVLAEVGAGQQRVEFLPSYRSRLIPQYYDHKNRLAEAATISITPTTGTVGGIDADLIAGGTIKGTVTALAGGGDLAGVEVCAEAVATPPVDVCGETDSSGEYELHSLLTGAYKIGFWGRGVSAEYQSQYYDGKSTLAQATPVTVTNGGETTGIDAALAKGSEVGGTLRAASTGAPLPNISVCLFAASDSGPERCAYSDESGVYRFQGLPSGSYQVGFSLSLSEIGGEGVAGEEDGFLTQFYPGVASRAEAQTLSLIAPQALLAIGASLLAPSPPPPPPAPPVVPMALVPAPPAVAVPPTKKGCKPGYRKQKVKGKARCVKVRKKKHRKHNK